MIIIPSCEWLNKKTFVNKIKCLYDYIKGFRSPKFKITLLAFPCPKEDQASEPRLFKRQREVNKDALQHVSKKSFLETTKFLQHCKSSKKLNGDLSFSDELLVEVFGKAVKNVLGKNDNVSTVLMLKYESYF